MLRLWKNFSEPGKTVSSLKFPFRDPQSSQQKFELPIVKPTDNENDNFRSQIEFLHDRAKKNPNNTARSLELRFNF